MKNSPMYQPGAIGKYFAEIEFCDKEGKGEVFLDLLPYAR